MSLRRVLEATVSGLLIALVAPPLAALVFVLLSAAASNPPEPAASGLGSTLMLLLGVTSGAYLLGVVPAFAAGLALPALRRALSPNWAAGAAGVIGTAVYASTFGSHLLLGPVASWPFYALPAFTGVAAAAWLASRIERRHVAA